MKKVDYHIHTTFSPDAKSTPEEHILAAIQKGIEEICFTDHNDYFFNDSTWVLNVDEYFKVLVPLKEKYKDQINIKIGIEVGLDMDHVNEIEKLVSSYPFDFVIGSIHAIHSTDIATVYHHGKSKEEYHTDYFNAMKACVEYFDCFDVLGHLDYVRRYGPYENRNIDYQKYQPIIDEIYSVLISKGKGIEINCSGYRMFDNSLPNNEQIKRFKELGGQFVTIGTDSHLSEHLGCHIEKAIDCCNEYNLKVATFTKRTKDK